LVTLPYPGFPTDLQGPFMTLFCKAGGQSIVTENVFEGRFLLAEELKKMGANIKIDGHRALIKGVSSLKGCLIEAPDLRGGAALVLAGLAAKGITKVAGVNHIDRGYEKFEEKLSSVGAQIKREK
jgi:UDP-N-acetylglucosamine 1-carboxyvinyltransferase